jgi:esterase/lipase superfamily enzyme
MSLPNSDDIAVRVLMFIRRLIGRVPERGDRLESIFPGWLGAVKTIAGEIRCAGEFSPYEILLGPESLTSLRTVEDLIEIVVDTIKSDSELGQGTVYAPDAAGQDAEALGLNIEARDFIYSPGGDGFITIPVWFATDRATTGSRFANDFFGPQRGQKPLSFGVVDVTIPNSHIIGQLEAPSFWRFQFWDDPTKHVRLADIFTLDEANFFAGLRKDLQDSGTRQAFIFIHGYNVTFKDAARRAGQITRDLAFPGVPILYSWPSQGRVKGYPVDTTNAQWTVAHLEWFLQEVAKRSGAKIVHLIAHSMGNLALVYAIKQIAKRAPIFNQIVLTAPDIDAATFTELAHIIRLYAQRVTLYASSRDRALRLSKRFNGYPRAGDASGKLVVVAGIDTIDATAVNTDVLGHSYFGNNRTVLSDIHYVVRGVRVADRAGMLASQDKSFWKFRP